MEKSIDIMENLLRNPMKFPQLYVYKARAHFSLLPFSVIFFRAHQEYFLFIPPRVVK